MYSWAQQSCSWLLRARPSPLWRRCGTTCPELPASPRATPPRTPRPCLRRPVGRCPRLPERDTSWVQALFVPSMAHPLQLPGTSRRMKCATPIAAQRPLGLWAASSVPCPRETTRERFGIVAACTRARTLEAARHPITPTQERATCCGRIRLVLLASRRSGEAATSPTTLARYTRRAHTTESSALRFQQLKAAQQGIDVRSSVGCCVSSRWPRRTLRTKRSRGGANANVRQSCARCSAAL